jgi:hypothetical protein
MYEIQLSLNFKYKLDITVCSNFNSYKSLRITACTQKHKGFTADSIAIYPKFPWVKDLVFLRTISFVTIAWGCQITTHTEGCTFSSYTLYKLTPAKGSEFIPVFMFRILLNFNSWPSRYRFAPFQLGKYARVVFTQICNCMQFVRGISLVFMRRLCKAATLGRNYKCLFFICYAAWITVREFHNDNFLVNTGIA